jgi:hypothetical protein
MHKCVVAFFFLMVMAGPTAATLNQAQYNSVVNACQANHVMCTTTCSKGFSNALSDCQRKCDDAENKCITAAMHDFDPSASHGSGKPTEPGKVEVGGKSGMGKVSPTGQATGTSQQNHQ